MIESVLYVTSGLVLLTIGGEFLVRAASRVAIMFGLTPLLVGLTIIAFGTSAPELGVSLFAAFQGNPEIALTNIVGSNIFNIGFILGICAIIAPLVVHLNLIKFDVPIMVFASFLTYIFCLDGQISRLEGFFLFSGVFLYTFWLVRAARKEPLETAESITLSPSKTRRKSIFINIATIAVSLAVLVVGSRLLVSGAVDIARLIGVSESLIGLTIVAAGTSLPEVATSVMATIRGQTDIAVGNVIGSNIINLFFILGISASLNTGLKVSTSILSFDMLVLIGLALLCFPLLVTARKLVRWEGALLLCTYITYTGYLVFRG